MERLVAPLLECLQVLGVLPYRLDPGRIDQTQIERSVVAAFTFGAR